MQPFKKVTGSEGDYLKYTVKSGHYGHCGHCAYRLTIFILRLTPCIFSSVALSFKNLSGGKFRNPSNLDREHDAPYAHSKILNF
jgi:hypothetical protein